MEMPEGWNRFKQEVETSKRYSLGIRTKSGEVFYPELIVTLESAVDLMKEMAEALESAAGYGNSAEVLQKFKEWK